MSVVSNSVQGRRENLDRLMSGGNGGQIASCDACGSTYFYSVNAEQFNQGFGTVEYNALSSNPRPAKICLCGMPLGTKASARGPAQVRGQQEEYFRSLAAARDYVTSNSIKNLAKAAVSPSEVEAIKASLLNKITEIETAIAELGKLKLPNKKADGPVTANQ